MTHLEDYLQELENEENTNDSDRVLTGLNLKETAKEFAQHETEAMSFELETLFN